MKSEFFCCHLSLDQASRPSISIESKLYSSKEVKNEINQNEMISVLFQVQHIVSAGGIDLSGT